MLEQILGFGFAALIFAILFYTLSKKEDNLKEEEVQDFWLPAFRVFFLFMTLLTVLTMSWFMIGYSDTRTTFAYDENGTVIGNVTVNFTVSEPIQKVMNAYVQGNIALLVVAIVIYVVAFVVTMIVELTRRRRKREGLEPNF